MGHKRPITNIGTVCLLTVFIVLCMVVFAALSLTEAKRDHAFTETLANHTTEYYTAASQAQQTLASIDAVLCTTQDSDAIVLALDDTVTASYDQDGALLLSYETPLNDSQAISVVLRVHNTQSWPRYDIISWRAIQTSEWAADNSLTLLE